MKWTMSKRKKEKWIGRIAPLVIVICFLSIWQFFVEKEMIDEFFFSSPKEIGQDFIELFRSGILYPHLARTLYETILGLAYGLLFGVAIAFLFGNIRFLSLAFDPIFIALYGLPKLALGPLFIIWFGLGVNSKVVMSAIMVFFLVFFNAYAGFRDVNIELIDTLKLMGATRLQITWKVTLPSCIPWIMASLRSGAGAALGGAIIGEYLGTNKGLGFLVQTAGVNYDITRVMSVILVMMFLMLMLDKMTKELEKIVLKWRPKSE